MNPCVHNTNSYVCQRNFSIVGSLLARFSVPVQQLLEHVVLALTGLISCHSVDSLPWHESYIFKSWKYNSLFCQKLEAPEAGPWLLWRLTLARRTKRRAPQSQSSARRSKIVFFSFWLIFIHSRDGLRRKKMDCLSSMRRRATQEIVDSVDSTSTQPLDIGKLPFEADEEKLGE